MTGPSQASRHARRLLLLSGVASLFACSSTSRRIAIAPGPGVREDIALRALSMIGRPYVWGGDDPSEGFDCSGLVHYVYKDAANISLPRQAARMSLIGMKIRRSRLGPADLVFFNTQRRAYSHVGLYIGDGRFVHAPARGKTIRMAQLDNDYWARRYNGARRPDI